LYVLGADWKTIVEEYLHTNEQIREYREKICDILRRNQVDSETIQQIVVLESVDATYLESCWHRMSEQYGTVERFLEEQLGLTAERRKNLKQKYTCIVKLP
ncbi:MAG: tyrosine-protein phosphatase, partial [Lachnospiraceae bacterium]|nr:tyrosine-protein phosphatase [Lachnospiraceae bacterium]